MGRQCRFQTYSLGILCVKVGGSFMTLTQNKDWFSYPLCMANSWGSWQLFLWQPYLGNLYTAKENTACLLFINDFLMAGALALPSTACVLGHGLGRHCVGEWDPKLCGPQHRRDVDLLEWVRGEPQRWSESWSTSLTSTGWERWECSAWRNLWRDLIPVFQHLKGGSRDLEKDFLQGHVMLG